MKRFLRIIPLLAGTLAWAQPATAQVTETQLTGNGSDQNPAWSPDGAQVLFDSNRSGNRDLWIIGVGGGTATQLTLNAGADQQPAWSPAGSTQVFASSVGGALADLYTRPSSGGGATLLDNDASMTDGFPAWSPDSTQIAYTKGTDIYVIPAAGGTPVQLTTDPATDTHPTWSPDGTQIAFQSDRSGNLDVWVIPSGGGTATQLTTDPGTDGAPDWSPDGTQIAFQSNRITNDDIWVMPAAGGAPTRVTTDPASDAQPDWSPAGNEIVFSRAGKLWIATFTGTDLAVSKTVDDATPAENDSLQYSVVLDNIGTLTATGVEVTDLLPAGVTYVSDSPTRGTYTTGTGIWAVDSLIAGAADTLLITATVDAGTAGSTITNTAQVTAVDQVDSDPTNDADSVAVTVGELDLAVTKTVDDPAPSQGGTVVYTVALSNLGPAAASGVDVTDLLPAGVTYVSDTPSQGTYTNGTGLWTVGALANGALATLTVTATVDSATAGTTVTNSAAVTAADQLDLDPSNDADSVDIDIVGVDVSVAKAVDNGLPGEADTIVYTVTATNLGTTDATGLEVTDLLPAGVTFASDVVTQGTYASGTGTWTIGTLTAAAAATLDITATVDVGTLGQIITNTASVTALDQGDLDGTNDSASVDINVGVMILQVSTGGNSDQRPAWSPDGMTIVFDSQRSGNRDLWSIPAAGGAVSQITTNPLADHHADFAPAGDMMVFSAVQGLGTDLYMRSLSGGPVTLFHADSANADRYPSWSPDSTQIAFEKGTDIFLIPSTGGTPVQLTFDPSKAGHPSWSPDGAQIAFRSDRTGNGDVFVIPSTGGTAVQLTTDPGLDGAPDWSSDGTTIAFHSDRGGASGIWVIPATGGTPTRLTSDTGSDAQPDWAPNNLEIAFARNSDIWKIVFPGLDIRVDQTVDIAAPNEGDTVTYTVIARNQGPEDATGVQITDLLPAGVTFVSGSATAGAYSSGTGLWTPGAMVFGRSDTLTITATVGAGTGGSTLTNTASFTAVDQTEGNSFNDSASASVTVQSIDLAVTKSVDVPAPNEGDTVVYTVSVTNAGPDAATGVAITDVLPTGVTYVSDSPGQGTYASGTGVWAVGSLANGAAATLDITATVDPGTAGTTVTNTATRTAADQADANPADDSDTADVTVKSVDLSVTKVVDDASPNEGGTVVYTVTLANVGPDDASGIAVTDLLPAGVTYLSDTPSLGTYASGTGVWTVGAVAAGGSATLDVSATVDAGTAGTTISNGAAVTAVDQVDTDATNDADAAGVTVQAVDLAVTKTVDDPAPNEGGPITYTVTVSNAGPDVATALQVTDLLPAGVTHLSDVPSQGTYASATGLWSVGSLGSGASATLDITAGVGAGTAATTITNTAAVSGSDQADTNGANDADSVDVTVQAVDLSVTKTVDDASPNEGGTVVYTVTVANAGPDSATGVDVTDLLPGGVTFVSDVPSQGAYVDTTGLWTVGSLSNGGSATLALTAAVDPGTAGTTILNTAARTTSVQADTDTTNDADSASVTVQAVDLSVAKIVDDPVPNEGSTVVYTVTVSNAGPDAATAVEVTDLLPAGVTYVSDVPSLGSYAAGTGLWSVGSVASGAQATLDVTATVDPGTAGTTVTNLATLTAADQADTNPANDADSAAVTVQAVDLSVSKVVDVPAPNEGGTVAYTVTVTNGGPDAADSVEVTDVLPAGVTYLSDLPAQGTYATGTGLWSVGTLANGASASLVLTATVDSGTAGSTITNVATASASVQVDTNPANDGDSASVTVQSVDLSVTKIVDDASPNEGASVVYTLTVMNNGPDAADGITVTDVLPAGMTFASGVPGQGTYTSGTGLWSVGSLANGAGATLDITATVASGTAGTTIMNRGTVTAVDQADPNPSNDSDSASVTVQAVDLTLTKTVDDAFPNEGGTVVYTLLVSNAGPDSATTVTVTDLLPAGVTYVSDTAGQGTYAPGTGLWTIGALANAASAVLDVTATIDAGTAGTTITNSGTLSGSDQADTNAANDADSADVTVQAVDLAVTKTIDDPAPDEGALVTYTVTVTNSGPDAATAVDVSDTLPAGVTFVSDAASQGTFTAGTGLWAVGSIGNGGQATLDITASTDSGTAGTTITNTAALAASDQSDTNSANDAGSAALTVTAVDLAVTKTVDDTAPLEGGTVVYTITVTNGGPDAASGVVITDTLPAGMTFVTDAASQGSYQSASGLWAAGSLAGGSSATLDLTATVDAGTAGTTIANTAALTGSDQADTNGANDSAQIAVTVQAVDLAVTKTVDTPAPNEGGSLIYSVTVTNQGPDAATGVEITDLLPTGVTYVSDAPGQGSYTSGSGLWAIGSLANGASTTLDITATVDAGTAGSTVTNTAATTASDQTDTNPANDTASAGITVQAVDLSVTKTVDDAAPNEGGTVVYTVTVTNGGPDAATGVAVTDQLPAGVTYVSDVPGQGTYAGGSGLWTVGSLANGASATLDVTASVDVGTAGTTIANTAALTGSDQADTNAANDSDGATLSVQAVDIAVSKSVDDATPNEGALVVYTIIATNSGSDPATGVTVTDLLPAEVLYVSDAASQGTYASGSGDWSVGTLASSASAQLDITASVATGTAGMTVPNNVALTGVDQTDTNASNDADSADITVQAVDLSVTKTVDDAAPNEGGTVVYTVTVTNGGPDAATGVAVTDQLPAGVTHVSDVAGQGTYSSTTGLWTVGTLSPGASAILTLTASVDGGTAGTTVTNTGAVTASDQADTNSANDSASAAVTVQAIDVAVTKTVDDPAPNEGATIVYTVGVTNGGPDTATGVQVTDILPAGVTYVSHVAAQGTYASASGVWSVGSVAPAASTTLDITATVDAGTAGTIVTNVASLSASDQADTGSSNDTASAGITIQAIDIAVTKTVDVAAPDEGTPVVFTVTVTNNGPDPGSGIAVADLLPAGLTHASHAVSQGTYAASTGLWSVGSLGSGSAATLDVTASVNAGTAGTTLTNVATLTAADQTDANGANDADSAAVTVTAIDLAVTKSVDDTTPNETGTVVYTVTVANNGPDSASGVQLTDALPAGVTYVSGAASQGSYAAGSGTWAVGILGAGASATLDLTATVDAGTSGSTITNTAATSGADQTDVNVSNDSASVNITVQAVDVAVSKTVDDPTPDEGGTVVYTVTASNGGPDDATGLLVTDLLPAGVTFVSASPGQGTYSSATGLWTAGTVPAGGAATLDVTVTVDAGTAGTTVTNTAARTATDQIDTNPANDAGSASIDITAVDIAVTKGVDVPMPNEGDTVVYTVSATNSGPDTASGVLVADLLPPGVTYVSDVPGQGSYVSTTGTWNVGVLATGGTASLTITATVDAGTAGTTVTNSASLAASDQADTNASNDSDTADIRVASVDLAVTKTVDAGAPDEGDTVTFTVSITNNGPDTADGVMVTDVLPAGITYASDAASLGSYDSVAGSWTVGTLSSGVSATLDITVSIDAGTAGGTLTNTAALSASVQTDTNPANDTASAGVTVRSVDLSVAKVVDDGAPNEGGTVLYTVTVANAGPDSATGVTVTDALPAGVTFVSAAPVQGTYATATGVWTIGTLTPGGATSLDLTATVDAGTSGMTITNTARLTGSDRVDTNASNDADSAGITVQAVDVSVSKSVDDVTPNEGDAVVYTVTVANLGPDGADGVEITDLLPAGVTYLSALASQGAYASATGLWSVGTVANGGAATLDVTATVDPGTSGTLITNTAALTAVLQVDGSPVNDADSAVIAVQAVDLAVTKTVDAPLPNEGDVVTYTVAITNNGPDPAAAVEVTDVLPGGVTYLSAAATQGSYADSTGLWAVGSLVPGAADSLFLRATVDSATAGRTITNAAALTASVPADGDPANDTDSTSVTVGAVDLAVTKFVDVVTPAAGGTVVYTVTVTNLGPDAASGVAITDALPAGTTYASDVTTQGTYAAGTGGWSVGSLAVSASATLTLTASVDPSSGGSLLTNTATRTASDQADTNPANDSASADISVLASTSVLRLTMSSGDQRPTWSPDAQTILFDSHRAIHGDLWSVPVSGGSPLALTGGTTLDRDADWSPVSDQIVFARGPSTAATDLYTVSASGGTAVLLEADPKSRSRQPAWSPDGQQIAFVKRNDIYVIPAAGGTAARLTTHAGSDEHPTWSPDGTQIAFESNRSGNRDVWIVPAAGGVPTQLTTHPARDAGPDWSPDGTLITFHSTRDGDSNVWMIPAAGGAAVQVTNDTGGHVQDPAWASNGRQIAYSRRGSIYVTSLPGVDIRLAKTVDNPAPGVGGTATFTIVATNAGPDPATGLVVKDALPPGISLDSHVASTGTYAANGDWTINTLPPGRSDTLTVTTTILPGSAGRIITNTAAVSAVDQTDGNPFNDSASVAITVLTLSAARSAPAALVPTEFALAPARPNPSRGAATIQFDVPVPQRVDLGIFDVTGRRVATLVRREMAPGRYVETWDGRDHAGSRVATGIYLVHLRAGSFVATRKLIRLE